MKGSVRLGVRGRSVCRRGAIPARLRSLCRALRQADGDIRDIILFGSGAFAPGLALDLDLLVTTTAKKDESVYRDAVADLPVTVDILVRTPGEPLSGPIALAVCATRYLLYGNGETLKEALQAMPIPTYEDAREYLTLADRDLRAGQEEQTASLRHKCCRRAFDSLFHAARHAAMTFLATQESRWGELRRALPAPFAERFRLFINTLHVQYSYEGNYPPDQVDEEFRRWRAEVAQFIADLEAKR